MRYAIIAAGEGSRLATEGIDMPKPLVEVNGEPLIDRLIRIFADNNAEEIVVICNDKTTLVSSHLMKIQEDGLNGRRIPLRFVVKSTPSSMHSLYEISRYLEGAPYCLTTVDTIFREKEFSNYIMALNDAMETYSAEGLMAVTDYIDDEKPLYVQTDDDLNITAFRDERYDGAKYISGGIYALNEKAIDVLADCMERGVARMRNFQRALVDAGLRLKAYPMGKILDVDHAGDIEKAENFINSK